MRHGLLVLGALAFLFAGCGDDEQSSPDTTPDVRLDVGADVHADTAIVGDTAQTDNTQASDAADSTATDTAVQDSVSADTTPSDVTQALDGFGALSGVCDVLDAVEFDSPDPFFFQNTIDFGLDPYDDADLALLSAGGQEIIADGNAGGSSLLSEVFAYEVLYRCENATLLRTELEVAYVNDLGTTDPPYDGSITDLVVDIDGYTIGVSVTRAVAFPFEDPYSVVQATDLLTKKLAGILESSAHVAPSEAWTKQVLSIIAYGPGHAASIKTAWETLEPALRADTILLVTVSEGDDAFLY